MPGSLDHRAEAEPVIIVAARIGPLDDSQAPVVADALAANSDALDLVGRNAGKVTLIRVPGAVSKSATAPARARPAFGGGERAVSPMPSRE